MENVYLWSKICPFYLVYDLGDVKGLNINVLPVRY